VLVTAVTKAHRNECIVIVMRIFAIANTGLADVHQKQEVSYATH